MKKILLVVLIILSVPLFAENLNLDDKKLVENFGALLVKNKLDSYDSVALSKWYLQSKYGSKWDRVKNDEFELEDAKIWALEQLKNRLKLINPVDKSAEYHLYLGAKFGKYNFKSNLFPVEALSENSYMSYSGNREFVSNYSNSKLIFENADNSVNFITMEKDVAKKFIKSRKNNYGNIDREIVAHYIYTLTKFEEDKQFTSEGSPMTIKFSARLKSVEFMDKKRKHILGSASFTTQNDDNEIKKGDNK